jgi:hypothetical protein
VATAKSLLAGLINPEPAIAALLAADELQPAAAFKALCVALDQRLATLDVERFDAALWLTYADAHSLTTLPVGEPDRVPRFAYFDGYTRAELETLIATGVYPEI